MKNYVYKVLSEDLTKLGAMGSRVEINWVRLAKDLRTAKKLAEDDYGKKLVWTKEDDGYYTSSDLGYVMYTLTKEKVHG